jgi:hypothetical protein
MGAKGNYPKFFSLILVIERERKHWRGLGCALGFSPRNFGLGSGFVSGVYGLGCTSPLERERERKRGEK